MLTGLLYPLQYGDTPLHLAAVTGHATCVERLLSTTGIDVNITNKVSGSSIRDSVQPNHPSGYNVSVISKELLSNGPYAS